MTEGGRKGSGLLSAGLRGASAAAGKQSGGAAVRPHGLFPPGEAVFHRAGNPYARAAAVIMRGAAREAENMEKERREQDAAESGHKASHEERAFSTGAARAPVQ